MPGGDLRDYGITDPYDSSYKVSLKEDCQVYMESGGKNPTPLIWRRQLGKGTVVFNNLGYVEKAYRGIQCAAYSLLGDYCAYPVINAAVFYLDDFPSPVPAGTSSYIEDTYQMSIRDFYTQV